MVDTAVAYRTPLDRRRRRYAGGGKTELPTYVMTVHWGSMLAEERRTNKLAKPNQGGVGWDGARAEVTKLT